MFPKSKSSPLARLCVAAACVLLVAPAAAAQTWRERVRAQADEGARAFLAGDYRKLADVTYPRLIRLLGGREQMVRFIERGMKQMRDEGFEPFFFGVGEPDDYVRAAGQLFVVVPTHMKMRAPGGTVEQHSYMIGISADGGANWTFIHLARDRAQVRQILPAAALRKLKLPEPLPPVFHHSQ